MTIDFADLNSCFNCDSRDVTSYYLLEWNNFSPDLVACCSDQGCTISVHQLKALNVTDLTLEEAQLLLIKARL